MDHRILRIFFLLCSLSLLPFQANASLFGKPAAPQFVPVDQAFSFDFQQQGHDLKLNWQIRDGYYLYRSKIELEPKNTQLAAFLMPKGRDHHDEFFGDSEVYENALHLTIPLRQASADATLRVTYQGCAAAGFCYPPETRDVPLSAVTEPTRVSTPAADTASAPVIATPEKPSTPLPFSPLWALLIGIGIAFTPCVLPMYSL